MVSDGQKKQRNALAGQAIAPIPESDSEEELGEEEAPANEGMAQGETPIQKPLSSVSGKPRVRGESGDREGLPM